MSKIFISSTVEDLKEVRNFLWNELHRLGHSPLVSGMKDFPLLNTRSAMRNCIEVVDMCDKFVLILNVRNGLLFDKNRRISITRAEFERAIESQKDIIVFIDNRTFTESQVFHKVIKNKSSLSQISLIFRAEIGILEFIEHIQHHCEGIRWIETYESATDILEKLKFKGWINWEEPSTNDPRPKELGKFEIGILGLIASICGILDGSPNAIMPTIGSLCNEVKNPKKQIILALEQLDALGYIKIDSKSKKSLKPSTALRITPKGLSVAKKVFPDWFKKNDKYSH